MELRKGIPASPGFAIGEALVLDAEEYRIPRKSIPVHEVEPEVAEFQAAVLRARQEAEENVAKIAKKLGPAVLGILQSHVSLLNDPNLVQDVIGMIRKNRFSKEYAVSTNIRKKLKAMESLDRSFVQRIEQDLLEVEKALLRQLLGQKREDIKQLKGKVIIVAHDLTPAQTASFNREHILGIVTDKGGKTSHTSLVAASLGIPAVVGLGTITHDVSGGDTLIIDGASGTVRINPDDNTVKRYQAMQKNYFAVDRRLTEQFRKAPAETKEGQKITIYANVDSHHDIASAVEYGAEGIGLYRTEYLFLNRPTPPSEREHMDSYLAGTRVLGNKWFTIRTLDLGADKMPMDGIPVQSNPFLGVRAIRLCFERMDLLQTQLRAILRISTAGQVGIMIPMISTLQEVLQVREVLEEIKRQLRREGEVFTETIPLGIMIEVPAAAIAIDQIIKHVDFVSIGTNDLVAYLMAVDRTNEKLADLYQPCNPAVLRLLRLVIETSTKAGKPVSVCGEMSSEELYVPLLLGLGLRIFSAVPTKIPEVKRVLRAFTIEEAREVAEKCLQMDDGRQIEEFLRERLKQHLPELL